MGMNIKLRNGGHKTREEGMCLLEAVAFVAGEPHGDHPACVDPVLGAFGRAVNDWMTDDERQLLVPIVHKLVGTAGDAALSLRRAMVLCDGTVRQILPAVFDGVGQSDVANTLRDLRPVTDAATARSAESAAWSAARSAESAAWSAARSAARSAAWSAGSAGSAARSAESAESAAWSAESAASAAWSAESAARSAARSAERSAESAARSAAWSAIVTIVIEIFNNAIEVK